MNIWHHIKSLSFPCFYSMPTILQLPLNFEPIFWWGELWGTSPFDGHLPKKDYICSSRNKTASFKINFRKVAPNSPCSLPSLTLLSCYFTPHQQCLPPDQTRSAPHDREAQLWQASTGVRNRVDRWLGQRRTNNKGALLFSSSGWLGSPLWHEQDKPPPHILAYSPYPTLMCAMWLGTSNSTECGLALLYLKKSNDDFSYFK